MPNPLIKIVEESKKEMNLALAQSAPFGIFDKYDFSPVKTHANRSLLTLIDEIVKMGEEEIKNTPEVDTDFNDGGDDEYRDRRIAIELWARTARLRAFSSLLAPIKELQEHLKKQ